MARPRRAAQLGALGVALGDVVAFAAPDAEAGEPLQLGLVQALWQTAAGRQEMQARRPALRAAPRSCGVRMGARPSVLWLQRRAQSTRRMSGAG
jgi:hypothetical protein